MNKKLLTGIVLATMTLGIVSCGEEPGPTECEHNYEYVSDGESGHHKECSKCHEETEIEDHQWDDGVETTGEILYTCELCGETKTETVLVCAEEGLYTFDNIEAATYTETFTLATGVFVNCSSASNFVVDASAKDYVDANGNNHTSVNRIKTGGQAKTTGRFIQVNMKKAGSIYAYVVTSSSGLLDRPVGVWDDATLVGTNADAIYTTENFEQGTNIETRVIHVMNKGTYCLGSENSGINFYAVEVKYDTCEHEFTSQVVVETSCNHRGETKYTCTKCNLMVQHADILRVDHNYATEWSHSNGVHYHVCTVCGGHDEDVACTADPAKHKDAEEPTQANPSTFEEDTCTICGGTWTHDEKKWVDPTANDVVIADASTWTSTSGTDIAISENCHYYFKSSASLDTEKTASNASTGSVGFKMDKSDDNASSFVNKYFKMTGMKAGDTLTIICNSGGGSRGLRFAFPEGTDDVLVPKNTSEDNTVVHTVTASEATNGVYMCAYTSKVLVVKITWNKVAA